MIKKNPKLMQIISKLFLKYPMLERNQSRSLSSNLPFFGLNMVTKRSHFKKRKKGQGTTEGASSPWVYGIGY
jgi:hypothetical protein